MKPTTTIVQKASSSSTHSQKVSSPGLPSWQLGLSTESEVRTGQLLRQTFLPLASFVSPVRKPSLHGVGADVGDGDGADVGDGVGGVGEAGVGEAGVLGLGVVMGVGLGVGTGVGSVGLGVGTGVGTGVDTAVALATRAR